MPTVKRKARRRWIPAFAGMTDSDADAALSLPLSGKVALVQLSDQSRACRAADDHTAPLHANRVTGARQSLFPRIRVGYDWSNS